MNTVTNALLNAPWASIVPGGGDFASFQEESFARHIPGGGPLDVEDKYTTRKNPVLITPPHVIIAMFGKWHEGSSPFVGAQEHPALSSFIHPLKGGDVYASHFVQTAPEILSPIDLSSFEGVVATLQSKGFGKSAARLVDLRFADDLEEGDKPLLLESARGFVKFMCNFQKLGEPRIGIFPRGALAVEWRIADDKHLLVQPLDSECATFAFIGPAESGSGGRYRLNGRGTIAKVIGTLQREGVDRWAT